MQHRSLKTRTQFVFSTHWYLFFSSVREIAASSQITTPPFLGKFKGGVGPPAVLLPPPCRGQASQSCHTCVRMSDRVTCDRILDGHHVRNIWNKRPWDFSRKDGGTLLPGYYQVEVSFFLSKARLRSILQTGWGGEAEKDVCTLNVQCR